MISKKAVEAFKRFYRDRGVYLNHGLDCHLSDALSAALPLLLEGKREEIARVIDPDGYWERLDSCNHALATVQMNDDQRHALTKVRDDELRCTAESLAKADRIIAMLGGGDVG